MMEKKSISMCQGKGSLSHNNREFFAKNIDKSRTENNIVFVKQGLGKTYHQLFNEAVDRYNAQQKRKDRRIDDYFQHLFDRKPGKSVITGTNKQKSFYEDLVQIGTMDDTGIGSADTEIAVACLREYMEGFQERNKNFHVFNAVMHLDEATPHLHIDYIPVPDRTGESRSGDGRSFRFSVLGRYVNIEQVCPLKKSRSGQIADKMVFGKKRTSETAYLSLFRSLEWCGKRDLNDSRCPL